MSYGGRIAGRRWWIFWATWPKFIGLCLLATLLGSREQLGDWMVESAPPPSPTLDKPEVKVVVLAPVHVSYREVPAKITSVSRVQQTQLGGHRLWFSDCDDQGPVRLDTNLY